MRRIWDAIGAIIITAIAVKLLMDMLAPMVPYLVIALLLLFVGGKAYAKYRYW